jgi:coproporphyrinogen III oxidase
MNQTAPLRERWDAYILSLQDEICGSLEALDGQATFREDRYERSEANGGGGRTRILSGGAVFEKAGVNTSTVRGEVTDVMRAQLQIDGARWYACGLSLVLHPMSPMVPTVHANWRYFELYDGAGVVQDSWFGGGSDLTPYYLFKEDATHFHTTLKTALDQFGEGLYADYKTRCDEYFINRHRGSEARGIGGVFYDHLRPENADDAERLFAFQQACAGAFLPAYLPIVQRRRDLSFSDAEKYWQEIRRGRYVEFNLIHDRGTLFGLRTGGRTESILMSLPATVRWDYDYHPLPGSREAELVSHLQPQDWVGMK